MENSSSVTPSKKRGRPIGSKKSNHIRKHRGPRIGRLKAKKKQRIQETCTTDTPDQQVTEPQHELNNEQRIQETCTTDTPDQQVTEPQHVLNNDDFSSDKVLREKASETTNRKSSKKKPIFSDSGSHEYEERVMIALFYAHVLCYEPKSEWYIPKTGTITKIQGALGIPIGSRQKIENVLIKTLDAHEDGSFVDLRRVRSNRPATPYKIKPGSDAEGLCVQFIEQGVSDNITANLINLFLEKQGIDKTITVGCVSRIKKRFEGKLRVSTIKKCPQSNSDHLLWKEARYNWVCHLLARTGEVIDNPEGHDWLDKEKLEEDGKMFVWEQVVSFDEVHKKQRLGLAALTGFQFRFPRDTNGNLVQPDDWSTEIVYNEEYTEKTFKFEKEGRFAFGVGAVLMPDASSPTGYQRVGKTCPVFDYTGKTMVNMGKWYELRDAEIARVKNIPGKGGQWVKKADRPKDEYWKDDPVSEIDQIAKGGKREEVLKEVYGVTTIGSISQMQSRLLSIDVEIPSHMNDLSYNMKMKLVNIAEEAEEGSCPHVTIDHRKTENPYKSRYGDKWEEEIENVTELNKYVPVSKLVEYMVRETDKLMEGTKFEGKGLFYHDPLSQLTAKSTTDWMKAKGYFEKWITPALGCNSVVGSGEKTSISYRNRPVGNSPELMVLDNSLNRDIHAAVLRCVAATAFLPKDDKRKFSLSLPKDIQSAYKRVVEGGAPASERIVQDYDMLKFSLKKIMEAEGGVVKGLASREGRRKFTAETGPVSDDVKAAKVAQKKARSNWLHHDAKDALNELFSRFDNGEIIGRVHENDEEGDEWADTADLEINDEEVGGEQVDETAVSNNSVAL